MFGANLKATNSSFQKGMTFILSVYVKKVMKLLAFIFEQPSYWKDMPFRTTLCLPSESFVGIYLSTIAQPLVGQDGKIAAEPH